MAQFSLVYHFGGSYDILGCNATKKDNAYANANAIETFFRPVDAVFLYDHME